MTIFILFIMFSAFINVDIYGKNMLFSIFGEGEI